MLDYSLSVNKSGANKGLEDELQNLTLQWQAAQARAQLEQFQKQQSELNKAKSMIEQYNADPSGFSDMEAAYVQQLAPRLGMKINRGQAQDRKGASGFFDFSFGKKNRGGALQGLLGGAVDSLLFDLIPDNLYSNRHNKGWTTGGKWAATIGSLALGGYGAIQGIKAAKSAASGAATLAGASADDILKVITKKYGDEIVKNLGDDAAATLAKASGREGLDDVLRLLNKGKVTTSKEIVELGREALGKRMSIRDFAKTIIKDNKVYRTVGGKTEAHEASSRIGRKIIADRYREYGGQWSNIDDIIAAAKPSKVTRKVFKDLQKSISSIDDEIASYNRLIKEATNASGKPLRGNAKILGELVNERNKLLLARKEMALAGVKRMGGAEAVETIQKLKSKQILERATLLAERSKGIDKIIKGINKDVGKLDDVFEIAGRIKPVQTKINDYLEFKEAGLKEESKEIFGELKKSFGTLSKKERKLIIEEAKEKAVTMAEVRVPKNAAAGFNKVYDALGREAAKRGGEKSSDFLKLAKALDRPFFFKDNVLPNMTTAGMMKSLGGEFANFGALTTPQKLGRTIIAIPAVGQTIRPAITMLAPRTPEDYAGSPWGLMGGVVEPDYARNRLSRLPLYGIPMGGDQEEIADMMGQ